MIPRITWRVLLLGAFISAVSAFGMGGVVYLLLGLESAKKAWAFTFSVVFLLNFLIVSLKLLENRSARYYCLLAASLGAHIAVFFYFFLVPVFFLMPILSFGGGVAIIVLLVGSYVNAQMARNHFLASLRKIDSDVTVVIDGVRGVSVRKLARTPDMTHVPNMFNFEPKWLSWGLGVGALACMVLGFSFRKAFPEVSVVAMGCGAVYIAGYMAQWFVMAYYKIHIVRKLEKKYGHPLVAMEFTD